MSHTRIRPPVPTEALREEHRKIREQLREYSSFPPDDRTRREWMFDKIHRQLLLHFSLEQEVLHPAVNRTGVGRAIESVEEVRWALRLVRQQLTELSKMSAHGRSFDSKMGLLRTNFDYYVDAEERLLFLEVGDMSRETQETLRAQLDDLRERLLDQQRHG